MPGSANVPWVQLIDPETNRREVIGLLRRGVSATVDVFALNLLGHDAVRLYDGSLTEWTADPALPVGSVEHPQDSCDRRITAGAAQAAVPAPRPR